MSELVEVSIVLASLCLMYFSGRAAGYRKGYREGFRAGTSYLKVIETAFKEPIKKVWRAPNGL